MTKFNWQVNYKDGSSFNGKYNNIDRNNVESVSIVNGDKVLDTLQVKDNFLIRKRYLKDILGKPKDEFFITATNGLIHFIYEDGRVHETKVWSRNEPFTKPNLRDDEK